MMMPEPLDYAAPELNQRVPDHGDVPVILLGLLQLAVAGGVLITGAIQPAVREAVWYAHFAFHWAVVTGGLNVLSSILLIKGALGQKDRRLLPYTVGIVLMLLSAAIAWLSFRILVTAEIYIANGPTTVPVNDERYHLQFSESRDAGAAMMWMTPVLILFAVRALGRMLVAMLDRPFA